MTDAAQGAQAKLATKSGAGPYTWDGSSEPFCFNYETLSKHGSLIDYDGICGSRSHGSERVRRGAYSVKGVIAMDATPNNLDIWLPRIFGASEVATDTFNLAETLPEFGVYIDRVTRRFEYTGCKVNRAVFRTRARNFSEDSTQAQVVEMLLEIIGKTEVAESDSFPSLTLTNTTADQPYVFSDCTLQIDAVNRNIMDFMLIVDNRLHARFTNSLTATSITPRDRMVTLMTNSPFTADEVDLYDVATAGLAASMTWSNSGVSTIWNFGRLQVPAKSPNVRGRAEIELPLAFTARSVGATKEIAAINDNTP